jgi:transposase
METRDFTSPDPLEAQRFRAWQLKQQGMSPRDIAGELGVGRGSVYQWLARARQGGLQALRARPSACPLPWLTPAQQRLIPDFLWHGAEAYGFPCGTWTSARVAKVIEEEFGVRYHKTSVWHLLKELQWTKYAPATEAAQRDEQAVRRWRDEVWPELQRRPRRRTMMFVDEARISLIPRVVQLYTPKQRPPTNPTPIRDLLSVMSGMTPDGRLFTLVRQEPLTGRHSVEFLEHLQAVTKERLLVIWDRSPIHRRAEVNAFVERTYGKMKVEFLPEYAPDLNPWSAAGWHHLRTVEMGNLVCRDLEELHEQLHLAAERLRQKPQVVRSFFALAGLTGREG